MLVDFARYSFNKAHSVAYGTINFRCAYAKYYGTEEFVMSAVKNVDTNKKAVRIPATANEAHQLGIGVHGVDIERSDVYATLYEDGNIYLGFNDVKGVSEEGAKYLVELRQQGAPMDSPESLAAYIKELSKQRSKENARRKKEGERTLEGKSPGQKLNAGHITDLYTAGAWERLEDYPTPLRDMQKREREMLNVILSDNCAEKFAEHADEIAQLEDTYLEANEPYPGYDQQFTLPGMVSEIIETKTRAAGKPMGIVTIEWEGETLRFAVFPNEWRSHKHLWHERTPGIFTIRHAMNKKSGKPGHNFKEGIRL
jgi:DNA polymerase III alpha subunit